MASGDQFKSQAHDFALPESPSNHLENGYPVCLTGKSQSNEDQLSVPEVDAHRLVHPRAASARDVNRFREIRADLLMDLDVVNPIVLVTGVGSRCGASFVARNLALSVALQPHWDAIVIDCKPTPWQEERIRDQKDEPFGLLDLLHMPLNEVHNVLRANGIPGRSLTGLPGLHLIPPGRARPAGTEKFASPEMGTLLDKLREGATGRCIVLDAPATHGAPEARILAKYAHRVVLVAGEGRHTPEAISAAGQVFNADKLAGVIYNQLP